MWCDCVLLFMNDRMLSPLDHFYVTLDYVIPLVHLKYEIKSLFIVY